MQICSRRSRERRRSGQCCLVFSVEIVAMDSPNLRFAGSAGEAVSKLSGSAESAKHQSPGRKPWGKVRIGTSPEGHARQAKRGVSPSAESAAQQRPGRKPWVRTRERKALKGRHRFFKRNKDLCRPCRADFPFVPTQGFGRFAALPWALLFRAYGASDVRQSWTRMPVGARLRRHARFVYSDADACKEQSLLPLLSLD
jgi:hypothetical protein